MADNSTRALHEAAVTVSEVSQTEQIAAVAAHYNHGMNVAKRWATFSNVRLLLRT